MHVRMQHVYHMHNINRMQLTTEKSASLILLRHKGMCESI